MTQYDAVVVGAGPNGLAAAIVLARAGLSVLVREANSTIGGGARTIELTLPGYLHDVGSAVHPMAAASPFFRSLPLAEHGLEWIQPPLPLVHPFDYLPSALLERSVIDTAANLGSDGAAYLRLFRTFVDHWDRLAPEVLAPILHLPSHPILLARFGIRALCPADFLAKTVFRGQRARGLLAGLAAHSIVPLEKPAASAIGLVMALTGHAVGWPFPRGGSQQISSALASYLQSIGGAIETNAPVTYLDELPKARATLLDLTPSQVIRVAAKHLPEAYKRGLSRYSYGPAIFKIDWALAGPIPWTDPDCRRTATLHLGSTLEEISNSERDAWEGRYSEKPYVLLAQQSLFDPSRAPAGRHTGWAYCHVPHGSNCDRSAVIEAQVERYALGFRDLILARHTSNATQLETSNANLVGGDIAGGANNLWQLLARPVLAVDPYRTPVKGLYLCSSSTPPGGGVHGMCGYHAATSALKHTFGR
jgi:phytoene dehydrogenase-like protein